MVDEPTAEFRVTTAHGTSLAADPTTGTLIHRAEGGGGILVVGRTLHRKSALLARMDGGKLLYPIAGREAAFGALPILLDPQPENAGFGLQLPGGAFLAAIPGGQIEGDRGSVGGWELFQLEQASVTPPAFLPLAGNLSTEALCRDLATDPGVVAGLTAALRTDQLRRVIPDVANRPDYKDIFPFLRTALSGGSERSQWSTKAHLRGGIEAHRWIVGDHTYGTPTIVDGQYGPLHIGRYCSIAGEVRIVVANHSTDAVTTYPFVGLRQFWPSASGDMPDHIGKGAVIGNAVWIGAGATILPGAKVGDGAIIGAQAVVAGVVPPFAVVVGNPARVTRRLFDDSTINRLLAVSWWDWPDHKVDRFVPLLLAGDIEAFLTKVETAP